MISKAYAKINLTLDVLAKREDGYHDLSTVMQTVSLHDRLAFRIEDRNDDCNEIIINSSDASLPCNEDNLCHKACLLFFEEFGIHGKTVYIDIEKNIPVGAGLGGGSSDCAETLKALNRILDTAATEETLERLGAMIGADVPFFIRGGCRKAEGIGDILTDVNTERDFFLILAKPAGMLFSGAVYREFDEMYNEAPDLFPAYSTDSFISEYDNAKRFRHISNMLAPVCEKNNRSISDMKKLLLSLGAAAAEMTGSGSTVFGVFDSEHAAEKALSQLEEQAETAFTGIYKTVKNN